ncbi:CDGSH iron-sulfur domain-containing protein [Streptomyces sp. NPDC001984]|uniref:CDGSH iron-sulfur domain-containing protein n=1 Tax=Streptomyces sp. NPDC002619 TaxID=3364655 RepID=UPI0036B7EEAF
MLYDSAERRCRIVAQGARPLLVEGPVEVTLEDGTTVSSDRFRVALCTCRRSQIYPWCDTSHRKSERLGHPGAGSDPKRELDSTPT